MQFKFAPTIVSNRLPKYSRLVLRLHFYLKQVKFKFAAINHAKRCLCSTFHMNLLKVIRLIFLFIPISRLPRLKNNLGIAYSCPYPYLPCVGSIQSCRTKR